MVSIHTDEQLMKNISFKHKIIAVGGLWSAILLICMSVVFLAKANQKKADQSLDKSIGVIRLYNDLLNSMINLQTGVRGYLIGAEPEYLKPFNDNEARFEELTREALQYMGEDKDRVEVVAALSQIKQDWMNGPVIEQMLARKKLKREMIDLNQFVDIFKSSKGNDLISNYREKISKALDIEKINIEKEKKELGRAERFVNLSISIGIPISICMGFILLWVFVSGLNKKIVAMIENFVASSHEMERMSERFSDLSGTLTAISNQVGESMNKTATAATEINSMTESNMELSNSTLKVTKDCDKNSLDGKLAVSEAQTAMTGVSEMSLALVNTIGINNKKLSDLVELVNSVKSKTNLLNDIVFQTKLLSFNASVEAARAGEHGKGFSIVAEEVGNLAIMSGKVANEMFNSLSEATLSIENVFDDASASLANITENVQSKIKEAQDKANSSDSTMNVIRKNISEMNFSIESIVNSSKEQSVGISDIKGALEDLGPVVKTQSQVSNQCAEMANYFSNTSESLSHQIDLLRSMFGLGENSHKKVMTQSEKCEDSISHKKLGSNAA